MKAELFPARIRALGVRLPLAVARVYENYLRVVVRDSAAVLQLTDLEGIRVSIGPGGSGAAATSEVLFHAAEGLLLVE